MNALLLLAVLAFSADRVQLSTGSAVVERPEGRYLIKAPADVKFSEGQVRIWRGGLLASLKWPVRIRTTAVVAAVRGTDLYVEGDYVCVCKGSVELSDPRKRAVPHPVTASAHTATRLAAGKWVALEKMHGHTDAELARLKAR